MPYIRGIDRFEAEPWPTGYSGIFGTPTRVNSPLKGNLRYSVAIDSPGVEGLRMSLSSGSPTKGWVGFAFQVPSTPASQVTLCLIDDIADEFEIYIESTGLRAFMSGGTNVLYGPITADTWYWVEMIFDSNDGTGTKRGYWRVNGVDQTTITKVAAGSTMNWVQLLSKAAQPALTWLVGGWAWGTVQTVIEWNGDNLFGPVLSDTPMPMIGRGSTW